MVRTAKNVEWEYHLGNPIRVGDVTVTPQSQALVLRGSSAGCVWNRPAALLVKRGDKERRMPIVDVTRQLQLVLYCVAGSVLGITVAIGLVRMMGTAVRSGSPAEY